MTQPQINPMLAIFTSIRSFDPLYYVGQAREGGLKLRERRQRIAEALIHTNKLRGLLEALSEVARTEGEATYSAVSAAVERADEVLSEIGFMLVDAIGERGHALMDQCLYRAAQLADEARYTSIPAVLVAVQRPRAH